MNPQDSLSDVLRRAAEVMFPHDEGRLIGVADAASDGDTALHVAASWGDRHACLLLLDAGAVVDALGDMGCTPLHCAVSSKHPEVAELLLERGADPDLKSELGFTPRELAEASEHEPLRRLLITHRPITRCLTKD